MMRSSLLAALFCVALPAAAQAPPAVAADAGWQACTATADAGARLACFDRWAQRQQLPEAASASDSLPVPAPAAAQSPRQVVITAAQGCHDRQYSELARFWELEAGSDCGTFGIRGYRPISLSAVTADNVNNQPRSANPRNDTTTVDQYSTTEMRLQVSIRTKVAQGLLTRANPAVSDSLWVGYTQQSYWQLFSGSISRPFRTTDLEPEMIYVYPSDYRLPAGWRLRYTGAGVVHQSNGRALPLSRSWNRVYLMAGVELDDRFRITGRVWERFRRGNDDNPGISDYIGRGEISGSWSVNRENVLNATLRHSLRASGRGSLRLEWLRALIHDAQGDPAGLRLHTQLFTGYGDSLIDYNNRRTVLTVGLSLVEW